ncbi:MAG: flagellar biosynthetic protein FliR [Hydrogenibacillus schlegelii]|uniref:Flagellar biosynthetic protein FliR n=1 Tax=Hydrogenibacillus schlegelii TaxID=1484 RepID=A0A947CW21_HYDSH|nr:flagellar biosynthetic protein FliR [Hydrogenibacillus schlegelii]
MTAFVGTAVLVMTRLFAFFLVATPFALRGFSLLGRTAFALATAFVVLAAGVPAAEPDGTFPLAVLMNAFLGLALGFAVQLFFALFDVAGGLVDYQMGLAIVNVLDPRTGAEQPLLGQLFSLLALFVFFVSGAHRPLLAAVLQSFSVWPPDGPLRLDGPIVPALAAWTAQVFAFGALFAAPMAAVLFVVDLALALLSRAVPQMNIFVVGLPVKIFGALFTLGVFLPAMAAAFGPLFDRLAAMILRLSAGG